MNIYCRLGLTKQRSDPTQRSISITPTATAQEFNPIDINDLYRLVTHSTQYTVHTIFKTMGQEDRDDDDNESAVRALNTAMARQARTLQIFENDDFQLTTSRSMTRHPSDENYLQQYLSSPAPGVEEASDDAPSDESATDMDTLLEDMSSTLNGSAIMNQEPQQQVPFWTIPTALPSPTSSNTTVAATSTQVSAYNGAPTTSGRNAADKDDDEDVDDDSLQDEIERLKISEQLLRRELELQGTEEHSLERLSNQLLEATEAVCATEEDIPFAFELRSKVAAASSTNRPAVTFSDHVDGMEGVMGTVMDAVMGGCHRYLDTTGTDGATSASRAKATPSSSNSSVSAWTKTGGEESSTARTYKGDAGSNAAISVSSGGSETESHEIQTTTLEPSTEETSTVQTRNFVTNESDDFDRNILSTGAWAMQVGSAGEVTHSKTVQPKEADKNNNGSVLTSSSQDTMHTMPSHIAIKQKSTSDSVINVGAQDDNGSDAKNKRTFFSRAKSLPVRLLGSSKRSNDVENIEREHTEGAAEFSKKKQNAIREEQNETEEEAEEAPMSDVALEDPEAAIEVEAFYQKKQRMGFAERLVSPEQHQEWKKQLTRKEWLGIAILYWVILWLLLTVSIILIAIVVSIYCGEDGGGSEENMDIISSPYVDMFPTYTKAAFRDPASPQSKAFEWLSNDPAFLQYTGDRKLQRFALATLYYSTGGQEWSGQERWLSYNSDECQWYFSSFSIYTSPGACMAAGGALKSLVLENNNMTGTLPPELALLTDLKHLEIRRNYKVQEDSNDSNILFGSLPTEIGMLNQLEVLDFSQNELTGSIPVEYNSLTNLRELRLHRNQLTGQVPGKFLDNLEQLQQLYLFENQLSGPIPTQIAMLRSLKDLFLYENMLASTLPTELGQLYQMRRLWLDRNRFSGTIPSEFGNLQQLLQLNLFGNNLSGTIPATLSNAPSLEQVRLESNDLTGSVPEELCLSLPSGDVSAFRILSVDCNEVSCDCDCTCGREKKVDDRLFGDDSP